MISPTALNNILLDNLTTAVILLDDDLRIIYLNPAAEIVFSISLQRARGTFISDIATETSKSISILEALEKKQSCTKYDAHLITHHNIDVIADYVITPFIDKDKACSLIEISVLDGLRMSREDVLHFQQEGNKVLMRGLAHEIKNPLGGIRGAAQLLAKTLPDESYMEYTNILIEEADRLSSLVDRMLGPHKLPNYQPTNIHEVVEHVLTLISAESQGKIALIKDYDPSIPELYIDKEQMIQAVLNIAHNAMEATLSAKIKNPKITFKTRISRHLNIGSTRHRIVINIDIIDNGPGVPVHLKDTLFYPMVSGRPEGTGLGLSIAQNIIAQHNGTIECCSQPGKTKFSIFLALD